MTDRTIELVVGIVIFALCFITYLPLGVRFIYKFYQLRNEQSFRKRYGYLSIITSSLCLAEIVVLAFLILDHANVLIFSFNFLWVFSYLAINWSLLLRCWLIYFQFNWHNCIISYKDGFMRLLTSKYFNKNWFIDHLKNYGNYEYCKKRLIILWFFASFIETILIMLYVYQTEPKSDSAMMLGYISWFFGFTLICGTFLAIVYFYFQLPSYNDAFLLNVETRYLLRILIGSNIIFILNVFMIESYASNIHTVFNTGSHPSTFTNSDDSSTPLLILILMVLVGIQLNFSLIYVSTKWVTQKIENPFNNLMLKYCNELKTNLVSLDLRPMNEINKNSNDLDEFLNSQQKLKNKIYLKHLFTNKVAFELFLKHVTQEFSLIYIVALVEFVQFKQYVYRVSNQPITIAPNKAMIYLYVARLPFSSLVYNYEKKSIFQIKGDDFGDEDSDEKDADPEHKTGIELKHVKRVCWRLFEKYIARHAEFYLGMPLVRHHKFQQFWFESRKFWIDQSRELTFEEIYHFFDECEIFLETMLTVCLSRFKEQPSFKRVLEKLGWLFDPINVNKTTEKMRKEHLEILKKAGVKIKKLPSVVEVEEDEMKDDRKEDSEVELVLDTGIQLQPMNVESVEDDPSL